MSSHDITDLIIVAVLVVCFYLMTRSTRGLGMSAEERQAREVVHMDLAHRRVVAAERQARALADIANAYCREK